MDCINKLILFLFLTLYLGIASSADYIKYRSPSGTVYFSKSVFDFGGSSLTGTGVKTSGSASIATRTGTIGVSIAKNFAFSNIAKTAAKVAFKGGPWILGGMALDLVWNEVTDSWDKQVPSDTLTEPNPVNSTLVAVSSHRRRDCCEADYLADLSWSENYVSVDPSSRYFDLVDHPVPSSYFPSIHTYAADSVCTTGVFDSSTQMCASITTETQPATEPDLEDDINSKLPFSGDIPVSIVQDLNDNGVNPDFSYDDATGPSSNPSTSTTSTTSSTPSVDFDPASNTTTTTTPTTTTTTTTTQNFNYGPENNVSSTTTTTVTNNYFNETTIHNGDTNTTTTTTTETAPPTETVTTEAPTPVDPSVEPDTPLDENIQPDETADLCETNPNILACKELGVIDEGPPVDTTEIPFNFTPVSLSSNAVCPTPMEFHLNSGAGYDMTLSNQPICDFATGIHNLILAICGLIGVGIVAGGIKNG